jgi:hypothetical protein
VLAATSPQGGVAAGARARERARAICLPFIVITSAPATLKDTMSALRALVSERAGEGRGRDGDAVQQRENRTLSEREREERVFPSVKDTSLQLCALCLILAHLYSIWL